MERIRKYIDTLIQERLLMRRIALLVSLIAFTAYAKVGYEILVSRPAGSVTAEEVALISLFCGSGGLAVYLYQKARE